VALPQRECTFAFLFSDVLMSPAGVVRQDQNNGVVAPFLSIGERDNTAESHSAV
jgi:hypothetical protein